MYRYTANANLTDNDSAVDEIIPLQAVSFIRNITVDIAAVYGEDLLILLTSPSPQFDEYVAMDDTRAISGPNRRDFDLGKEPGDPRLGNVAPYVFVETGGKEGFTAPYSGPDTYNADEWNKDGAPYAAGNWELLIEDLAANDPISIGSVTIRYCGVCSTVEASAEPSQAPTTSSAPSTSSVPSVQPSTEPSVEPSTEPTVTQDGPARRRYRRLGDNLLRH